MEFDGPVADVAAMHFRAHQEAARAVGWSCLDERSFWRITRTKGRAADLLRGAKPTKLKQYFLQYDRQVEDDASVALAKLQDQAGNIVQALANYGAKCLLTLGSNKPGRIQVLERAALADCGEFEQLNADPRRRPGELKVLGAGDPRCIVLAATDSVVRAAQEAGLFTVGISGGVCAAARLHQAGADVVYANLSGFLDSLASGADDMVRAGLLPLPLS